MNWFLVATHRPLSCLCQIQSFELFSRFGGRWPLQYDNPSVCFSLQRRSIESELLPFPPHSLRAFFLWSCEPVLPNHGAHLSRRSLRERISRKEQEHIGIDAQPTFLRAHN